MNIPHKALNRLLQGVAIFGLTIGTTWADPTDTPVVGAPTVPSVTDVLATLKNVHPRILLTSASLADLKARLTTDAQLKAWYPIIHDQGQKLLIAPVLTETGDLNTVRQIEDRVRILGFLYLVEGDKAYADRAWNELDAAVHWPIKPAIELNEGEMTCALALGYDWLYDAWTPDQRAELVKNIVDRALNPAIANPWWTKKDYNWNQVCSGGVGMGALAVASEEPDIAAKALQVSLNALPYAMASYAPDGGWKEGPSYWDYATTFGIYFIASLESATGTDANFSKFPGFSRTGLYALAMTGPTNLSFNFADAEPVPPDGPFLFWLANRFNLPSVADFQRKHAKPSVMDLIWYPSKLPPATTPLPTNLYFSGADVVCLRGSWADDKTSYVGFKGGDNKFNHSHLDLGSFVFDANGCRFAQMLGSDSYSRPGYFDFATPQSRRYTYYRIRAEGADTLVINPGPGPDQDITAEAPIIKTQLDGDSPFAIADLTAAYAKDASKVRRGITLIGGRQLLVQDEIQTLKSAEVWWFMHTKARIDQASQSPDGRTLTLSGIDPHQIPRVQLKAQILSPADARFEVMPATPLPGTNPAPSQGSNADFQKLAIHLKDVTNARIIVTLTPVMPETASFAIPEIIPLDKWSVTQRDQSPAAATTNHPDVSRQANTDLPFENPGFEEGLTGWSLWQDNGMSQAVLAAAHTGKLGLRVTDTSTAADGCNISSRQFPAIPGKTYDLKCWFRTISGAGGGIYLKFWDANNQELPGNRVTSSSPTWTQLEVKAVAPPTAALVGVWIHTGNHLVTTVDFDDFTLTQIDK